MTTSSHHHKHSAEWAAILERGHHFRHYRRWLGMLPSDPRCELCLAPFSSIGGTFVRMVGGIRPSTLNPRFCNRCDRLATLFPGGAEADVALLFVDIRGSTGLAETMTPAAYSSVVDRFYRGATDVLIDAGAMIEKLAGDEVTAIFASGFAGPPTCGMRSNRDSACSTSAEPPTAASACPSASASTPVERSSARWDGRST